MKAIRAAIRRRMRHWLLELLLDDGSKLTREQIKATAPRLGWHLGRS